MRSLKCSEISAKWIQDFDYTVGIDEIDSVLFLPGIDVLPNFNKLIHYCQDLELEVFWIPLTSASQGVWLTPKKIFGAPFLGFENLKLTLAQRFAKRTFDLVFSILFLIVFLWLYVLISLAILSTSGRPILYSSVRIGRDGEKFRFFKFRTMRKNADLEISSIKNIHKDDHVIAKDREDPRITPLGKILRKYSLDELPQFFNVLNNSMSVVGPRPAMAHEVNKYDSVYERRLYAKPGITGPWQIGGRSDLNLEVSVALDLNYVFNWSFTQDIAIILKTVVAVIKGKGAY